MLLLWHTGPGIAAAAPGIRLSLLAVGNPYGVASPSIALSVLASTSAQFGLQAAPSIRLALAVYAIGGHTIAGNTVVELEYNA